MKLKEGTELLVTGPGFFEKTTIKLIKGEVITLDNMMKINKNLKPLDKSRFTVELFDENKYQYLVNMRRFPELLEKIKNNYKNLQQADFLRFYDKVNKLIAKFEL